MSFNPPPLNPRDLRVLPLSQRRSLSRIDDILIDPDSLPAACSDDQLQLITDCTQSIRNARTAESTVSLIYGAHLLRNGASAIVERLIAEGWITHLATNGAGTIHDWEFAHLGVSTENVRDNVATGTFGSWDETGRNIHTALLAGGLQANGYGEALGAFIELDGTTLPSAESLRQQIADAPGDRLTPARADLLIAMEHGDVNAGRIVVEHPWRHASIVAAAYRHGTPLTVHPGIGYDIISNHPMFSGSVIGRAAEMDYRRFASAVGNLDQGVVLSVGSAIMGPQVFEKSLSFVNNLRLQQDLPVIRGHAIYVVDLQEGGQWDWTTGEPPKENPAYYLRFCKSYSRMGGRMQYLACDNTSFIHHLYQQLKQTGR